MDYLAVFSQLRAEPSRLGSLVAAWQLGSLVAWQSLVYQLSNEIRSTVRGCGVREAYLNKNG